VILSAQVMHRRLFPVRYRFTYRVFSLLLDLDSLPALHRRLRLFSHNRFNLFSFHDRDHGPRDGQPLRPWIDAVLAGRGIELAGGPVRLLCFPRVLGYVFNPLSVWYCQHADGTLRAVLCEVSNTFGERHSYLLHEDGGPLDWPVRGHKPKVFHVSPFIPMDARYQFRLSEPGTKLSVLIREYQDDALMLVASLHGRLQALTDARLAGAFLRYPLLTLKVMALIHWQALKIWLRGGRFHPRPPAPETEVT